MVTVYTGIKGDNRAPAQAGEDALRLQWDRVLGFYEVVAFAAKCFLQRRSFHVVLAVKENIQPVGAISACMQLLRPISLSCWRYG